MISEPFRNPCSISQFTFSRSSYAFMFKVFTINYLVKSLAKSNMVYSIFAKL